MKRAYKINYNYGSQSVSKVVGGEKAGRYFSTGKNSAKRHTKPNKVLLIAKLIAFLLFTKKGLKITGTLIFVSWFLSTITISTKPFNVEAKGETCPAELPLNGATSYESKDIPRDTIDRDGRGDLFDKYFGKDARVMRAVCEAENQEKNPLTIGDLKHTFWQGGKQYGMSVGLCQVRIMPDRNITIEEMQNPEHNIEYSKHALFDHGGFKHWTKYNNGEYKRFLK